MRGVPGVSTPGKVGRNMDDKHRPEGVEQIRPISLGKTRGWESLMVVEDRTAHVRPLGDVIDHELSEHCVCGPRMELVRAKDGGDGWVCVHASLDGREVGERH